MNDHADPSPASVDIRQIVAAILIADLRSYRLAAEALHMTQPTLTRLMLGAEAALGTRLFRRGWSGTDLTSDGEAVIRRFRTIAAAIAQTEREVFGSRQTHPRLHNTLSLRQLAAVEAVVRGCGASAAAAILRWSQPNVSRTLSQTASHLGLSLFRRSRSGMEPLPPALSFARLHSMICYELALIPRDLARVEGELVGRVAIGMLPFSGQALISRAFAELTNRHPRIRLICVPGSYNSLVEALRRREIDRIVGVLRGDSRAADLSETFLYSERFTIVARHDHSFQAGCLSVADLGRTNWVVAPHGTPVRTYFEGLFARIGEVPPIQTCEMLSFASAEQMLAESNSVGMLTYSEDRLKNLRPDLRHIDIDLPDPLTPIGLTRLLKDEQEPAVLEFESVIRRISGL